MKTEVIMEREFMWDLVSQKSKSWYFSLNDLERTGNKRRLTNWRKLFAARQYLSSKASKEFIEEIEEQFGKAIISGRGRNSVTWVHPFIFLDVALAMSPTLKVTVYWWFYDYLPTISRPHKKMAWAISVSLNDMRKFKDVIMLTARGIKAKCGVTSREKATTEQLEKRDKIHDNIALLCEVVKDPRDAIRIWLEKA